MSNDRRGIVLGVVGIVVGVLGIVVGVLLSWYFYEKSRTYREPVFAFDPYPTVIYSAKRAKHAPIRVLNDDGTPLGSDVYLAHHTLWNRGNQPVLAADVLEPIRLTLGGMGSQVLPARAVRMSRTVVNCKAVSTPEQPESVTVTFAVLDELDGCTIEVYFTASERAPFSVDGTVVGVASLGASSGGDTSPYRTTLLYTVSQYTGTVLVTFAMLLQFWTRRYEVSHRSSILLRLIL